MAVVLGLAQDLAEASEALGLDLATEALALDWESSGSDDRSLRHKLCNQLDLQGTSVRTHPSTLLGIQELEMVKVVLDLGLVALELVLAFWVDYTKLALGLAPLSQRSSHLTR